MANPASSITGIAAIIIFAGLIGVIFLGNIMGMLDNQKSSHATINTDDKMMKLILYDSMIAYTCDEGGNWDGVRGKGGERHWGSWKELKGIWKNSAIGEIKFDKLNKSMPFNYQNMPCRGSASNLPLSGGKAQATGVVGQEWIDDQEGKYSRIKFRVNKSFSLPQCFVHYTQDTFPDPTLTPAEDMYEKMSGNQVTNSWFLVTAEDEKSAFHRGGAGAGTNDIDIHYDCQEIADSPGNTQDRGSGPIMSVNVIDDHLSSGLPVYSSPSPTNMPGGVIERSDDDIGHFAGSLNIDFFKAYSSSPPPYDDPRPLREYNFTKGTRGYVQTNIGCDAGSIPYTLSNTPGKSDSEITDNGKCANTLHPFIVITEVG